MRQNQKAIRVIEEALSSALAQTPSYVLLYLNKDGYDHSGAMEIARRMVRELHHAGWQPKEGGAKGIRSLEDGICFGLSMANCSRLASQNEEWIRTASAKATRCICSTLGAYRVVLVRRNSGEEAA